MAAPQQNAEKALHGAIQVLISRMGSALSGTKVIPWGSPVPSFGDLSRSLVATLGLNPSSREFVDLEGNELTGKVRRLHTLSSLSLKSWNDARSQHVDRIIGASRDYFTLNPYDGWFRALEDIISGTGSSFYSEASPACHLDLIPYATACKWTALTTSERKELLVIAGDTLGLLLRKSPIRLIVLNGRTVVTTLEKAAGIKLTSKEMPGWMLPRGSSRGVRGFAYTGIIRQIGGIEFDNAIRVIGYNHNIQSSFGVTATVKSAIRDWVSNMARESGLDTQRKAGIKAKAGTAASLFPE